MEKGTGNISICILGGIGVFLAVAFFVWNDNQWVKDLIEIVGILISLIGVLIAIYQVNQVAEISEATNQAVKENRQEIKNFLSFSDMGHLAEKIKNAQNYIRKEDFPPSILLIQTIKDDLVIAVTDFESQITSLNIDLREIIKNISIDLRNLVDQNIFLKKDLPPRIELNLSEIHHHLEIARESVIKIETYLKQTKI